MCAAIHRAEPPTESCRPQTKICKYNFRYPMNPNRPSGKQNQAKLRVRRLLLPEDRFRDFADQGQRRRGSVVALDVEKRFDQFALIDANEVARLTLEIPDTDIGQHLERGTEAALWKARAAC